MCIRDRVVTAGDGEEAVRLADDTIDLIILDVMMPVKSGYVACSEIRKKTMAPILFLTARTQAVSYTHLDVYKRQPQL